MEITEGKHILRECPNGHSVHDECLKEWLLHSPNCPLCNTPYPQDILEKGKKYLKEKEEKKLGEEKAQIIEQIAEKMVYLKFQDIIDNLIERKNYEGALDKLHAINEKNLPISKRQQFLFLRGKVFYLNGRYDMAINLLFKLVKEKYDYPEAFLYLGKAYQELGLEDKAQWAFDRIPKE